MEGFGREVTYRQINGGVVPQRYGRIDGAKETHCFRNGCVWIGLEGKRRKVGKRGRGGRGCRFQIRVCSSGMIQQYPVEVDVA